MTTTFTVLIGNSDNRLEQWEWSQFVEKTSEVLTSIGNNKIHFEGGSPSNAEWQNYCWVLEIPIGVKGYLEIGLRDVARKFRQDSIAVICANVEILEASK